MAKYVATVWKVVVNNVDLSDHAFSVDTPQTKDQVDVSGFGGTREFIPGVEDATITVQFLQDYGANSVHPTLQPLFAGGSTFKIWVQPFSTQGTSATNPIFGGTASIYEYNGGAATLNERAELTATFKPASGSKFTWGTVVP